jgi:hypothetical protein
MSVHCFTSISLAYLSRARILSESIRRHHPEWTLWLIVSDVLPPDFELQVEGEFDHVIWAKDLVSDLGDGWMFQHDVVEFCTAVKGRMAQSIMDRPDCQALFYFDPDIVLFSRLDEMVEHLNSASILLTPHLLHPERDSAAIKDNEISTLHYGTYNLGFLGVHNDDQGRRVIDWWAERLEQWCYDRPDIGIFVDQKWFNLVPGFFEGVKILRNPGYNVASWNISQRAIEICHDGEIRVNGVSLGFYHFTKIEGAGEAMIKRYGIASKAVFELSAWYRLQLERLRDPRIPAGWWAYANFEDGSPITRPMRRLYRYREDLQQAFPNPYRSGPDSLQGWFDAHADELLGV